MLQRKIFYHTDKINKRSCFDIIECSNTNMEKEEIEKLRAWIEEAVDKLFNERQKEVLTAFYGLYGTPILASKEMDKKFGYRSPKGKFEFQGRIRKYIELKELLLNKDNKILDLLFEQEKQIFCTFFGLDGRGGLTLKKIGEKFGCKESAMVGAYTVAKERIRLCINDVEKLNKESLIEAVNTVLDGQKREMVCLYLNLDAGEFQKPELNKESLIKALEVFATKDQMKYFQDYYYLDNEIPIDMKMIGEKYRVTVYMVRNSVILVLSKLYIYFGEEEVRKYLSGRTPAQILKQKSKSESEISMVLPKKAKKSSDNIISTYFKEIGGYPNLDKEEEQNYWMIMHSDPSSPEGIAAREKLINSYLRAVVNVAKNYIGRGKSIEDLISMGNLGLIDAVAKYKLDKGVRFLTYAEYKIEGAIVDELRQSGYVLSSSRIRIISHVLRVRHEIEKSNNGRVPTDGELAEYLGMTENKIRKILQDFYMFGDQVCLDATVKNEDGDSYIKDTIPNKNAIQPDKNIINSVFMDEVRQVKTLSKREIQIITLYYGFGAEKKTFKEIGELLGVTESRVSQLHSKALEKLKTRLEWRFL